MNTPDRYRHTQIGWVLIVSLLLGAVACLVLALLAGPPPVARAMLLSVAGLMAVLTWIFGTLTAIVREGGVEVRFGPGLIRKTCPLSDFVSVAVVRNKWWYGWGVRLIPRGWLYNVSGLNAVELARPNGRVLRIGTDEPQALQRALRDAMGAPGAKSVP